MPLRHALPLLPLLLASLAARADATLRVVPNFLSTDDVDGVLAAERGRASEATFKRGSSRRPVRVPNHIADRLAEAIGADSNDRSAADEIYLTSIYGTTNRHRDHRGDALVDTTVGFVMLDDADDVSFVYGEDNIHVPVRRGSLVAFRGSVPHHTVVQAGAYPTFRLLGPITWSSNQKHLQVVGDLEVGSDSEGRNSTDSDASPPSFCDELYNFFRLSLLEQHLLQDSCMDHPFYEVIFSSSPGSNVTPPAVFPPSFAAPSGPPTTAPVGPPVAAPVLKLATTTGGTKMVRKIGRFGNNGFFASSAIQRRGPTPAAATGRTATVQMLPSRRRAPSSSSSSRSSSSSSSSSSSDDMLVDSSSRGNTMRTSTASNTDVSTGSATRNVPARRTGRFRMFNSNGSNRTSGGVRGQRPRAQRSDGSVGGNTRRLQKIGKRFAKQKKVARSPSVNDDTMTAQMDNRLRGRVSGRTRVVDRSSNAIPESSSDSSSSSSSSSSSKSKSKSKSKSSSSSSSMDTMQVDTRMRGRASGRHHMAGRSSSKSSRSSSKSSSSSSSTSDDMMTTMTRPSSTATGTATTMMTPGRRGRRGRRPRQRGPLGNRFRGQENRMNNP